MKILDFGDVIQHLEKQGRQMHLLIGNGFSMAYAPDIFSYTSLHNFLTKKDDQLLNRLFSAIRTKNFELIMQQLGTTLDIVQVLEPKSILIDQILEASSKLKEGLLEAIQMLHPHHVFKIPEEKAIACSNFLRLFLDRNGQLFSTNYDLLLYWVLMRQLTPSGRDGFGRELENREEVKHGEAEEWSELRWGPNRDSQNIHYLHGALHLFDAGVHVIKEEYNSEGYLLDNIRARLNDGHYPIFVTAGNGDEKLEHIRHNQYLSHCFNQLERLDGSLVTFGFNFGPFDEHIIGAINSAARNGAKTPPVLRSVYIGVYSEQDVLHIESIEHKFVPKVRLFDAKTARLWG